MSEAKTKTYQGFLRLDYYKEDDEILHLSGFDEPLAEVLSAEIKNKFVTARYWITDKKCSKEEAVESYIRELYGKTYCKVGACYSEYTGYLWTDEECEIGGHDIIQELHSFVGKYLILEVEIHDSPKAIC